MHLTRRSTGNGVPFPLAWTFVRKIMTHWAVSNADILDAQSDGLVCSANPSLNLSGGVGGAILLRHGNAIQDFLHSYLRAKGIRIIAPGDVVVSPSCGTTFTTIAHAVAIDTFYDTNTGLILKTLKNAINQLIAANCRTIVSACLGCGYGRCSIPEFASVVSQLIALDYNNVDTITFMTTNVELADAIAEVNGTAKS